MIGDKPTNIDPLQKLRVALRDKAKKCAQLSFLCPLRQGVSSRCARSGLRAMPCQRRSAGRGWPVVCGHRAVWCKTVVGRSDGRTTNETYQSQPVRRVYLPKPDGKQRPLGFPMRRDRVVQTAALLVLEPIFAVDMQPEQYAYREGRSASGRCRKCIAWCAKAVARSWMRI